MIEFFKDKSRPLGCVLKVNGEQMDIGMLRTEGSVFIPRLQPGPLTNEFIEHSFSDLPSSLGGFELGRAISVDKEIYLVRTIARRMIVTTLGWSFESAVAFDSDEWKQPFSMSEYARHLVLTIEQRTDPSLRCTYREQTPDDEDESFELRSTIASGWRLEIEKSISSANVRIKDALQQLARELASVDEQVRRALASETKANSVVTYFTFPEEVRVPCEQYLLYFVKFLQDLGVEATSELKHDVGQVLFSVTPNDSKQALNKIRLALDVYLRLPSSPISDSNNEAIAIQRLEANVLRLRSDLKLAAAELQAKNATIETQQLTIEVHKRMLSGEIVADSLRSEPVSMKANEKPLGAALAPAEAEAIPANLPEIFRKFKDLFLDT